MGILDVGGGAAEGLETLLARHLAEEKFAESKRATKSTEGYRDRSLDESTALRRQTQESLDQNRQAAQQQQTDNRISRTVAFRPIGAKVTPEEYESERSAGVPEGVYKVNNVTEGDEEGEGNKEITFGGTQAQLSGAERIADAERRAQLANEDRDAARKIASDRENRLTSWGPPVVTVGDSGSNTGARVVPRGEAGGREAPGTSSQRVSVSDSQIALDTLDRITKNYSADKVGPIEGRVNTARQSLPFVPTKPGFADFAADSATLRNAIIRAITGAQMSQPEAERIMSQIPSENDKEDVWQAKAASTRLNLENILAHKGGTGGTTGGGGGANAGSGNIKSITRVP